MKLNAKNIKKEIKSKIRKRKKILFPENDERVLEAALKLQKENIITPIIVVNKPLPKKYMKLNQIIVSENERYINALYKVRKKKGMTIEKARELIKDPIYYATMMLYIGDADGIVSGAMHPTAHTLRPALQIIKTRKKNFIASSCFLLIKDNKEPLIFADCGMNIRPTPKQLAQIAYETVETAKFFGIKPKVGFLSFSTKGSAKHEEVDRIKEAVKYAKKILNVPFDGELQFDAALIPEVAKKKAKDSKVAGKVNVFICPDLNAGNIGYKITQRLGKYEAIGPIVQGLKKPVNDLSRGCSVNEIIELAYITALQAQ